MKCDRCGGESKSGYSCSWFNTETLCDACQQIEQNHPDYDYARRVEIDQVKQGNFNYEGIGWPGELGRVDRERMTS